MSTMSFIGLLMMIPGILFIAFILICALVFMLNIYGRSWQDIFTGHASDEEKQNMLFTHLILLPGVGLIIFILGLPNPNIPSTPVPTTTSVEKE